MNGGALFQQSKREYLSSLWKRSLVFLVTLSMCSPMIALAHGNTTQNIVQMNNDTTAPSKTYPALFDSALQAQSYCPGDTVEWLNLSTNTYQPTQEQKKDQSGFYICHWETAKRDLSLPVNFATKSTLSTSSTVASTQKPKHHFNFLAAIAVAGLAFLAVDALKHSHFSLSDLGGGGSQNTGRVVAIHMNENTNRQSDIESLRIIDLNGEEREITREECVSLIKSGWKFYVEDNSNEVAYLRTNISADGTEYVETVGDYTAQDNLLSLPRF